MTARVWKTGEIIEQAKGYFLSRAVESPRLDAELLLGAVLNKERLQLYVNFDQPLEAAEVDAFRKLVRRRAAGEPVAYLTGRKFFMGLEFLVTPDTLIPRPETELLAEAAISRFKETPARFLDIGAGSGALALSILKNCPGATAAALDVSAPALLTAQKNAGRFGLSARVDFINMDAELYLKAAPPGQFDFVVANPPYIPTGQLPILPREVRREPGIALDGGADGLLFYRLILQNIKPLIKPGAPVFLEIGKDQAEAVESIAKDNGFAGCLVKKDYAGLDRILIVNPP